MHSKLFAKFFNLSSLWIIKWISNVFIGRLFSLQETLAIAMQKIVYVLGSFTSDAEIKVGFAM